MEESEKLKKGWRYGAGAGLVKGGRREGDITLNFLKVYQFTFGNYCLQKCVVHLKKNPLKNFFCHHNFMKKVILSCLKTILKIFHKLR